MKGIDGLGVAALAALGALALPALPASAFPSYGTAVDDYCTRNQRTPAKPYNGNCAVCHNPTSSSSDQTALFTAYKSGNLDAFCPAAVANRPPVLAPIGSQTMSEQGLLDLRVSATDPDGDRLALEASGLPTGALFTDQGGGKGQLLWMPSYDQAGNYSVTIKATDSGSPPANDSETFTISVGNVNRPPVLAHVGNWSANPGEALSIPLSASDPDGDALAFGASGLPAAATLSDHADGTATLAWTPGAGDVGSVAVTLTVTDDGVPMASDAEQISITVGSGNHPPVLDPIGARAVPLGEPWTIRLSASDADGDALAFGCDGAPPGAQLVDGHDGTATLGGAGDAAGNFPVLCRVSDAASPPASDEESFTLTIGAVNRPPVLDPIGATREGEAIFVRLTAHDPDGDALRFAAQGMPSGAELLDHGDGTAELRWQPGAGEVGSYPLTFTVTDDGTPPASASADFTLEVAAPSAPATPQVRRAVFARKQGALRVHGRGAPPDARVEVFDAASGSMLTETSADRYGLFTASVPLASPAVPCSVAARAEGRAGKAKRVEPAPAGCRTGRGATEGSSRKPRVERATEKEDHAEALPEARVSRRTTALQAKQGAMELAKEREEE